MEANSGVAAEFGFKKQSDAIKEETKTSSPVEEQGVAEPVADNVTSVENNNNICKKIESTEDVNEPYVYRNSVTIALVRNYSLYRKKNDKSMPKRKDYIGSSVSSSKILSSNKLEVETYFPNIVGLSPNDKDFVTRVKQHLNNIKVPIDEIGKSFDISFHYHHKKDYYKILHQENEIERDFARVNRQDLKALKAAIKEKCLRLNDLEASKCTLGYPINMEDYLIYRHCLLYNDVAKDMALINSDPNVRFYFKDDAKEADKLRKYRLEVNKAKTNYVACLADSELFDAVYISYCASLGLPVLQSLVEDRLDREIKLDKFSTEEPIKFNAIFNNKDVKLVAVIERLIAHGELVRPQYNQNITSVDGEFIGSNMKEAVIWFKDPKNAAMVSAYYNRLKNL